ncbi:MAG: hypothetical protein R3F24_07630 [Gammaproteobacteria bacterium]
MAHPAGRLARESACDGREARLARAIDAGVDDSDGIPVRVATTHCKHQAAVVTETQVHDRRRRGHPGEHLAGREIEHDDFARRRVRNEESRVNVHAFRIPRYRPVGLQC